MEKKHEFSIWFFIIAGAILLLFQTMAMQQPEDLSYAQFRRYLQQGQVKQVVVGQERIKGTLKLQDPKTGKERYFTTIRVQDPDLVKELQDRGVEYSGEMESWVKGLVLAWLLPMAILFLIWQFMLRRVGGPGEGLMSLGKSKAKVYIEKRPGVTFNDVAGVDEAKEELQEVIEFLRNPQKFQRLGGKIPKGVLLVGPPGTGKTLLAKAVAGEASVPFLTIAGSDFVEMFVGLGAARVRDLFAQSLKLAPCIVFIDELDAVGKVRGVGLTGGHEEREQTLNQLLVEMDGFEPNTGVIIMAATNRPEILDPALLRPGRFDRQVLVDRPDINGREAILRIHARGLVLGPDVDLHLIAARTPGFVGADLANVMNEAALLAARQGRDAVGMTEIEEAIDRVVAGLQKKQRVISAREKEIIATHEAGHALVAASLPHTDPVHRISIIPRGIAALGHTMQLPTEDRYLLTRTELLARLAVLLGGRTAEELVFGDCSTGAQDDLQRATELARSMVAEFGMSRGLGLMSFGLHRGAAVWPPYLPAEQPPYSEETARTIDQEVGLLLTETHKLVREILAQQQGLLAEVAARLQEREVLEGDELRALLARARRDWEGAAACAE